MLLPCNVHVITDQSFIQCKLQNSFMILLWHCTFSTTLGSNLALRLLYRDTTLYSRPYQVIVFFYAKNDWKYHIVIDGGQIWQLFLASGHIFYIKEAHQIPFADDWKNYLWSKVTIMVKFGQKVAKIIKTLWVGSLKTDIFGIGTNFTPERLFKASPPKFWLKSPQLVLIDGAVNL